MFRAEKSGPIATRPSGGPYPTGLLRHTPPFRAGSAFRGPTLWRPLSGAGRMLAQPLRQRLEVGRASAAQEIRKLRGVNRRKRARLGSRRRPAPPGAAHPAKKYARFSHLTGDADASFWAIGATGEPGPIFCKLPVMTRSVSRRPFTLTASPSVGPSVTIFCSALLPSPTT